MVAKSEDQYHAIDQPYQLAYSTPIGRPDSPDDASTMSFLGLQEGDALIVVRAQSHLAWYFSRPHSDGAIASLSV